MALEALKANTSLERINLKANEISDEGAAALAEARTSCPCERSVRGLVTVNVSAERLPVCMMDVRQTLPYSLQICMSRQPFGLQQLPCSERDVCRSGPC